MCETALSGPHHIRLYVGGGGGVSEVTHISLLLLVKITFSPRSCHSANLHTTLLYCVQSVRGGEEYTK